MFRQWNSPASVFQMLKRLSAGQPCDMTGIEDFGTLAERGGVQWPFAAGEQDERRERRLFEDGQFFHEDRRVRFLCEAPRPMPEQPNEQYPFLLLTGRGSAAQWHTQTRTEKSAILRKLYPRELYAEINPQDAKRLAVRTGGLVRIASQRGELAPSHWSRRLFSRGKCFCPCTTRQRIFLPMPSSTRIPISQLIKRARILVEALR